jgi:hypothetical protein
MLEMPGICHVGISTFCVVELRSGTVACSLMLLRRTLLSDGIFTGSLAEPSDKATVLLPIFGGRLLVSNALVSLYNAHNS